MTTILLGISCRLNAPVELRTRLEYLKVGNSIGREPVAIIAFLKLISLRRIFSQSHLVNYYLQRMLHHEQCQLYFLLIILQHRQLIF